MIGRLAAVRCGVVLSGCASISEGINLFKLSDEAWDALRLSDEQRLDLLLLTGWYHAISFVARAARVPLDAGAPRCRGSRP
jgi:hypothetical protein